MLPQWIIEKKRNGESLTDDEVAFFITGYTTGSIPDYQMAALAMAIYFTGMTASEISAMTRGMMHSGKVVDTSRIPAPKIDKHSTGGVGDKLSIPLAALVASCGVVVPMISGRGLGITGGTLDKLESIPGFRIALDEAEFLNVLEACGCSMIGQTEELVPADRKLYALRDVTATVPSIPLIVSSIMSKKLAEGIDGLVLDVKCGSGAFMKTPDEARRLARGLVEVGRAMGKKVTALITAMDQPLGRTVGNALEMVEAIAILRGEGPADSAGLTLRLAAEMLVLAGVASSCDAALLVLESKLRSGEALSRFRKMVQLQGGRTDVIDDPRRFAVAPQRRVYPAPEAGIILGVDAGKIGRASLVLGAGRRVTADTIDHAAGLADLMKVGEPVAKDQPLVVLHAASTRHLDEAWPLVREAFTIGEGPVPPAPLVLEHL